MPKFDGILERVRKAASDPDSTLARILRERLGLKKEDRILPAFGLLRSSEGDEYIEIPIVHVKDPSYIKGIVSIPVQNYTSEQVEGVKITDGVDGLDIVTWNNANASGLKGIIVAGRTAAGNYARFIPVAAYNDTNADKGIYVIPVTPMTSEREEGTKISDGKLFAEVMTRGGSIDSFNYLGVMNLYGDSYFNTSISVYDTGNIHFNINGNFSTAQANLVLVNTATGVPNAAFTAAAKVILHKVMFTTAAAMNMYLDTNTGRIIVPRTYLAANSTVVLDLDWIYQLQAAVNTQIRFTSSALGAHSLLLIGRIVK